MIPSARDAEDGGIVEVLRELLSVECGARDEELDVRPFASNVLHETEEDIRVQRALMSFVHHHHTAHSLPPLTSANDIQIL